MQKEAIIQVVKEWMEHTSFFLVDVKISPGNEVMVEFDIEQDSVVIDDCVSLSTFLESRFDRNVEDYALTVGSAGLGQPFKVLKQYIKFIGEEVDVLPGTGKKCTGVLKTADQESFSIERSRKVKTEGAKRPVTVSETIVFKYEDVRSVRYIVRFFDSKQ